MKNPSPRNIALLIASLCLSACGDRHYFKDLNAKIAELKQVAVTNNNHANPLPAEPTPVKYTATESRTPFINTTQKSGENAAAASHPLQAYSLSVLRFVGTVDENGTIIAFIQAPDNKVYPAKEGDLIGNQFGKITHIDYDKIDIMEKVATDSLPLKQRLVTLQLKEGTQ